MAGRGKKVAEFGQSVGVEETTIYGIFFEVGGDAGKIMKWLYQQPASVRHEVGFRYGDKTEGYTLADFLKRLGFDGDGC